MRTEEHFQKKTKKQVKPLTCLPITTTDRDGVTISSNSRTCGCAVETQGPFILDYIGNILLLVLLLLILIAKVIFTLLIHAVLQIKAMLKVENILEVVKEKILMQ